MSVKTNGSAVCIITDGLIHHDCGTMKSVTFTSCFYSNGSYVFKIWLIVF